MANLIVLISLLVSARVADGLGVPDLTCFITPPVRDLKSTKPIELLAVRAENNADVTMTFSARDDGHIYSNGNIVEFGQIEGRRDRSNSFDLLIQYARLSKPEEEYLEPTRFGIHYCDMFSGPMINRAPLLIYNQRTLIPKDGIRTHVFSVDDTLELCVDSNLPKTWKGPIEWAFNGKQRSWLKPFTGSTCIKIKHVQTCQAGIYEAYRRICGRREKLHAFFDVRVRSCPDGYHSPPECTSTCDTACVTGYCGDDGDCVCANGFTNTECDVATQGIFGSVNDAAFSTVGLDEDGRGSVICTEHAGCSCPSGWKGIDCDEECDELSFGPDCAYECGGGTACDRFDGGSGISE